MDINQIVQFSMGTLVPALLGVASFSFMFGARFTKIETEVSGLRAELGQIRSEVKELRVELKEEIKEIRTDLNQLRSEVSGLRESVAGMSVQVNMLFLPSPKFMGGNLPQIQGK